MRMNGFNNCIAGIVERFGQPDIVCYDKEKVIDQLQVDGMSYDDAIEHMDQSVAGSKFVWLHDIDFDVEFTPDNKPHLRLVH